MNFALVAEWWARDKAGDLSVRVKTDLAAFDQACFQPLTCPLQAGFGPGQRDPELVGEQLLRLAGDVA
jgi:hypothetical protein